MLTEKNIAYLKQKGINGDDLNEIESYDETTGEVLLKNGKTRQLTEIWTRVMGYFRPLENFNVGKKSEFAERKYFSEEQTLKNKMCQMAAE